MDMKISALLLLLLAATWTASQGKTFRDRYQCCTKLSKGKIPHFMIKDYKDPDPNCPLRAALVQLPTEAWACVNPEAKWLQKYLSKQKKPNSNSK